jgi:selenide,water dikinase
VTGRIDPSEIWTNTGAKPGDVILLTKPLGLGILATALKAGRLARDAEEMIQQVMGTLNRAAAETLRAFDVHACTDVTGFGLLGHLREMTAGSGVDAEIDHARLPLLPGAEEFATEGTVPGGTRNNYEFVSPHVTWGERVPEVRRLLACDAQTSGGLLVALPENESDEALRRLHAAGVRDACVIGRILREGTGRIDVR